MISLLEPNNKLNEHKNSLTITYPRTINIIFGHYPYLDILHNFILEIKNNISKDLSNYTNVKGNRTSWNHFINNSLFNNFISYFINKHQSSHPDLFQYFFSKNTIENACGNEIKKGDSLVYHSHPCLHGILYLTKGCDLILPELNLKITPDAGDYYIFPSEILHGFDPYEEDDNRYSLIFNIEEDNAKKFNKTYLKSNGQKNI